MNMKKSILFLVTLSILFSGCSSDDKNTTDSEIPVSESVVTEKITVQATSEPTTEALKKAPPKNFFYEDDRYAKRYSDYSPTCVVARDPAVYIDGEEIYFSSWGSNMLYRFDKDGHKNYVCDGAWKLFRENDTMYCADWEGATNNPFSLAVLENDEKTIIEDNCFWRYGKTAIYCIDYDDNKLYSISYDTNEKNYIMDMPSDFYLYAEYKNRLWFGSGSKLYSADLDGTDMKIAVDSEIHIDRVSGFRNGYIYYQCNGNNIARYSIETGEICTFKIGSYIMACNFTNDNCILSTENGLFAYDADFNIEKKLSDKGTPAITVSDDLIIIQRSDENGRPFFEQIDTEGNVLETYILS